MIEKVTVIVGMPGSGKTHLGKEMVNQQPSNTAFLDDLGTITDNAELFLFDWAKKPINKNITHLIISDVYLCFENVRNPALNIIQSLFKEADLNVVYFENNMARCLKNIEDRKKKGDKRNVEGLLDMLKNNYIPPENSHVIHVYEKKEKNKLNF